MSDSVAARKTFRNLPSVAETHPDKAWMFVDPEMAWAVTPGSGKRAEFQCADGHRWNAMVCSTIGNECGCPYCSGRSVLVGFNDIATTHPEAVGLFVDPDIALTLTASSNKRAEFRCPDGHHWNTKIYNVVARGGGCSICAKTGFDRSRPAFLYIVDRPSLGPILGISNRLDWRRLYSYADDNNEIRVIACFLSCDGGLIADAERWLIACFCTPAPRDAECFDGCARESFDNPLDVPAAVAMMRADGRFAEFIPAIDRSKYKIIDCSQEIS